MLPVGVAWDCCSGYLNGQNEWTGSTSPVEAPVCAKATASGIGALRERIMCMLLLSAPSQATAFQAATGVLQGCLPDFVDFPFSLP